MKIVHVNAVQLNIKQLRYLQGEDGIKIIECSKNLTTVIITILSQVFCYIYYCSNML